MVLYLATVAVLGERAVLITVSLEVKFSLKVKSKLNNSKKARALWDPYAIGEFCTLLMKNDIDPTHLLHDADTSGYAAAKRSKQDFLQSNPDLKQRFEESIVDIYCSRHATRAAAKNLLKRLKGSALPSYFKKQKRGRYTCNSWICTDASYRYYCKVYRGLMCEPGRTPEQKSADLHDWALHHLTGGCCDGNAFCTRRGCANKTELSTRVPLNRASFPIPEPKEGEPKNPIYCPELPNPFVPILQGWLKDYANVAHCRKFMPHSDTNFLESLNSTMVMLLPKRLHSQNGIRYDIAAYCLPIMANEGGWCGLLQLIFKELQIPMSNLMKQRLHDYEDKRKQKYLHKCTMEAIVQRVTLRKLRRQQTSKHGGQTTHKNPKKRTRSISKKRTRSISKKDGARKKRRCGLCGELGHNRRSCSSRSTGQEVVAPLPRLPQRQVKLPPPEEEDV